MSSGNNIFLIVSLVIAGLTAAIAVGTFGYDRYLQHQLAGKQAKLSVAQQNVDQNTIEEFVRLRDRLANGENLLSNHVMLSQFFDTLEGLTLQNVRFSNLRLSVAGDHTARLQMTGTAKSFNALAAQSNAFAAEKRIKRAIFSNITLNDAKLVGFTLTADIDPKLVVEGSAVPASTTTTQPSTVPPTTATSTPTFTPVKTATTTTAAKVAPPATSTKPTQ